MKAKALRREQITKNIITINKKAILNITMITLIVFSLSLITVFSKLYLTNISRENFAVKQEIEQIEKEIDIIKSDLIATTNVSNIQRESQSKGFVYNENLGYIK